MLKFGDRSHLGALMLATSLVADLQLFVSAGIWAYGAHINGTEMTPDVMSSVVSFAGGALLANVTSVVLLIVETVTIRR